MYYFSWDILRNNPTEFKYSVEFIWEVILRHIGRRVETKTEKGSRKQPILGIISKLALWVP